MKNLIKCKQVERSIIKKYRKDIWSKFTNAIKTYELINEDDKICVCISGGKDSMLLAKCMQELHRYSNIKFEVKFLVMDPGYNKVNRNKIEENAGLLNIPIEIFNSKIFDIVANLETGSPCYLCARMRRGNLYSMAKEMGCNKIALGHHYSDVVETILMSIMYSGEIRTMMPKLKSKNFENMELIRPLYLVKEDSILSWKNYNNLDFINCACRFLENCDISTETPDDEESTSKRLETKKLLANLKKKNPNIEKNIFRSMENINMGSIIGYKIDEQKVSFLDNY